MSSGGEVSGEETKVDLPPPEKKQSPVSDGSDDVLECAYPSDVSDSESSDSESTDSDSEVDLEADLEADREADCESDCECSNEERARRESDSAYFAQEEFVKYFESVRKSGGFDVIPLPVELADGSIARCYSDDEDAPLADDSILSCTHLAIKEYNSRMEKHLEFVKVRKTMSLPVAGCMFYITFDAKDAGITKTYQSVVFNGITKSKVLSFRLNPTDDAQGSSDNWLWERHIYKGKRVKRVKLEVEKGVRAIRV